MLGQDKNSNLLLSLLSPADYDAATNRGAVVDMVLGTDLAAAGDPIHFCWFPLSGLASVIAEDTDGRQAEVGMIGYEGMVNGGAVIGNEQSTMRVLVQVAGKALKVDSRNVTRLAGSSLPFLKLMLAFNNAFALQAAFSALAYSQYPIPQRLARWALMCGDRVGDDHIDLTHEALSIMLGVRRAGVTVALHTLVKMGAISTRRGGQSIRDRSLLLGIAGAGYGPPETEYKRLVTPAFPTAYLESLSPTSSLLTGK